MDPAAVNVTENREARHAAPGYRSQVAGFVGDQEEYKVTWITGPGCGSRRPTAVISCSRESQGLESRSQDPVLIQQGVDDDPQEKRHDHGDQEDGLERVPGTLGARLAAADAAAPPDHLAAAVFARGRAVAAGLRR
ncbi:hypothetical protein PUN28_004191 [Cardiocondyla obscurior]|uniref:Uncharacterized protein n=1 Tax=Cardiocondyla obscurior TaxID=286306 RepID=A0AAW2GPY4_9HYME